MPIECRKSTDMNNNSFISNSLTSLQAVSFLGASMAWWRQVCYSDNASTYKKYIPCLYCSTCTTTQPHTATLLWDTKERVVNLYLWVHLFYQNHFFFTLLDRKECLCLLNSTMYLSDMAVQMAMLIYFLFVKKNSIQHARQLILSSDSIDDFVTRYHYTTRPVFHHF